MISVLILVPGWPPTRNRNIREYIKPQENTALILPKIHSGIYFTLFLTFLFCTKKLSDVSIQFWKKKPKKFPIFAPQKLSKVLNF